MSPERILRIAKWELGRNFGELNRETIAVVLGILLVTVPVVWSMSGAVDLDRGLYEVGISGDSPYLPVVESSTTFVRKEPSEGSLASGGVDLLIDGEIRVADTAKGRAALEAFRDEVGRYNRRLMSREPNETAAFPVRVDLVYEEREFSKAPGAGGGATSGGGGGRRGTGTTGDGGGGIEAAPEGGGAWSGIRSVTGGAVAESQEGLKSPYSIRPPFPFGSLVLAFAFIVPINFVAQAYASSVMEERIGRRGEMLLVTPASRYEIVFGKTLPYLVAVLALVTATAWTLGGGVVSVASVLPLALAFLSASFFAALLVRSFKELTFVMVSISVFLTAYAFLPAVFTDIHPVAAISPITAVIQDLRGEAVPIGDYAFATLPLYLASGVLINLGHSIYREEDLFTQKSVPAKLLDALSGGLKGRLSVAKLAILLMPFVFGMELLGIASMFALPLGLAVPFFLAVAAVVEEVFKSLPVYAGMARCVYEPSTRNALVLGTLAGAGFFLGEKLTLLSGLVGLNVSVELGRAAFGSLDTPLSLLVLAPLILRLHGLRILSGCPEGVPLVPGRVSGRLRHPRLIQPGGGEPCRVRDGSSPGRSCAPWRRRRRLSWPSRYSSSSPPSPPSSS